MEEFKYRAAQGYSGVATWMPRGHSSASGVNTEVSRVTVVLHAPL